MPRINNRKRRDERKVQAVRRAVSASWGSEQIARLDSRLGVGVGATKERARCRSDR